MSVNPDNFFTRAQLYLIMALLSVPYLKERIMAEATITHFKEFEPERALRFAEKVMQVVGVEIYGIEYGEVTTKDVTLIVQSAQAGSATSASAGTEVKIDLDDEEWPRDHQNIMVPYTGVKYQCRDLKNAIGDTLLGGVNEEEGAIVNVWVRQFPATGWYGVGYQTSDH